MTALDDYPNMARAAATWSRENAHLDAATPLKRARVRAGYSQRELGRRARLHRMTVIRAERPDGHVSEGSWMALAVALGRADRPWSIRP